MEVSIFGGLGTDTAPLLFLCAENKSQGLAHTQGEGDCVGSYRGEDPGDHKSQLPGGQLAGGTSAGGGQQASSHLQAGERSLCHL